ncbi:MAG: DUF4388 domain-containing protein [Kofleriaceae bacterium]
MPDPSSTPCILVAADSERVVELVGALSDPLPTAVVSKVDVIVSSGGDDTIDIFQARKPHVVVITATLDAGDAASLVEALRGMVPRAEVAVVVIGDSEGPIRTALDAIEMAPDRFVARPLAPRTLRFAVASALEAVMLVRGPEVPKHRTSPGTDPGLASPKAVEDDEPTESTRTAQRARWEALADSIVGDDDYEGGEVVEGAPVEEPAPLPPPVIIRPRRQTAETVPPIAHVQAWKPGTTDDVMEPWAAPVEAPTREPTLILREDPNPAPIRSRTATDDVEPTIPRTLTMESPVSSRTKTGDDHVDMAEREKPGAAWSEPMPLAELLDRPGSSSRPDLIPPDDVIPLDDDALDEIDDGEAYNHLLADDPEKPRLEVLDLPPEPHTNNDVSSSSDGRDFARQLRAKMSMMAQRLFQGGDAAAPAPADLAPRHDHHTEIDLASLGEETPLGAGATELESRASQRPSEVRDLTTSPGSWDTQVRERGLPDTGELVRGTSDAAMLVAKMFATGATGRVGFRRNAIASKANPETTIAIEIVVYFDQGRPVFASSSEPLDRMGELLVREGKITAAQYERCQTVVAESGRRMGEILVDFGYLKRRELLPAVRRHVEDIVYSLFGWDRGTYFIALDSVPSAERIRLSRHPAALVLEGIRRKLDRTTLERLVGPPSTILEIGDRDRINAVLNTGNTGDLTNEERAALAALDGQSDLSQIARTAGVDVADVLPLAWGLCVLGLATARRTDTEVPDESTALVGETDLAIDRERVRARWQLVTEADYFALLGVRRDATTFEIRRAYQSARRDFAVDSFPNDLRRELAQELDDIAHVLDEAFRVLRDDRLRGTYLDHLIE